MTKKPRADTPEDWPIDRDLQHVDDRLGPFDNYADWSAGMNEELNDRLGESGVRLLHDLGTLRTYLHEYDLTTPEAVAVLEYLATEYEDEAHD